MTLGRTILAALIALSVALLPAAGGAAAVKPVQASSHMTMADGCDGPPSPCPDDGPSGCSSMAACAIKCFAYAAGPGAPVSTPLPLLLARVLQPSEAVRSHQGSPPFRPPRA